MSSDAAFEGAYEDEQRQRDIASLQSMRPIPRISIQAFRETEGVARPIERASEDRGRVRAHRNVHMGGIPTSVEFCQGAPTPNPIIVESRQEPKALLNSLRKLAECCDPSSKVVVIGHCNDVGLYRDLVRSGV